MSTSLTSVLRGTRASGGKIRVLIVDDSVVIRHLLRQALEEDSEIDVVGAERHGVAALAAIPLLKPDVVTLDIEMPEMDGLETLRHIRKRHPKLRTIMFSTLTTRGASKTFEALALGADDYVAKASNAGSLDLSLVSLRSELVPKIKQFFGTPMTAMPASKPAAAVVRKDPGRIGKYRVIAIGVSTGGPQALGRLIPRLPGDLRVPVVLVQHMPPMFTRLLAERLQAASPLKIEEAVDGACLAPGSVLIAPGDYHMRVRRSGGSSAVVLDQGPHENSCRPSVDVLFRSLAEEYRDEVLGIVLTGMGHDGLRGMEKLKAAGSYGLAQDEASSVVWGMPGAIVEAGLADQVLPLDRIAPEITRLVSA